MRTRIISAFPGTGKTFYYEKYKDVLKLKDSDSSLFHWTTERDGLKWKNAEFPENYIRHIQDNIGKCDFIFVSSHREVREALMNACLFFYLVYPDPDDKESYLKRYRDRGSDEAFVAKLSENWDKWIRELNFCEYGCSQMMLHHGWNLENAIQHIVASENGEA